MDRKPDASGAEPAGGRPVGQAAPCSLRGSVSGDHRLTCIGAYTLANSELDVYMLAAFGLLGFLAARLRFEMAPMLLGFILGPLLEEHLRRSLLLSRGSLLIFLDRPISAALLAVALVLMLGMANSTISSRRAEVFAEG